MAKAYTVTQVNNYIKNMFDADFLLSQVTVKGEVSNCKYHTSGHIYFTLKDDSGTLAAVMFKGYAATLKIRLKDGLKVSVTGSVKVYERDGKYQIYVKSVSEEGDGELYKRFLELKEELTEMGMFAAEYKKPIPRFSKKIGVVTASTGAAIQDIINISKRRNPYVEIILYPAIVQGEQAKYSIVDGINTLDKMGLDVIIVGRGGGSIEDLWAFNEEMVARAIFASDTPIISAVGHETDFTIADFVSDLRAPTPSAAAELAVCDIAEIEKSLNQYAQTLSHLLNQRIRDERSRVELLNTRLRFLNPVKKVEEKQLLLINLSERLEKAFSDSLSTKKHMLSVLGTRLDGLSPLKKLSQGYSLVSDEDDNVINSVSKVTIGQKLTVNMLDGKVITTVDEIKGE